MIQRLNRKQALILKALARYKFLTYKQIIRLGIEKHRSNLSGLFSGLRDSRRPLVKKIPHRNGTEAKHFLTKKGMELLMELYDFEEESIRYVKGDINTDTQDQKHRVSTISCQIELDLACYSQSIEVVFCDRYIDKVGNNRVAKNLKSKTAILFEGNKTIKADMTFMLQTSEQKELYLFELENGKDSKKSFEKCIKHGKAILKGDANNKYSFKRGYRTLWVFEYNSTMVATMDRLRSSPFFTNMKEYFLSKPLSKIEDNFFDGWLNIAGEERNMY